MPDRVRRPFFEIRASAIQGLGAFALRRIRTGSRIIEYLGERISPREAARRYDDDASGQPHVLLFTVDRHTCIDGGVDGNDARYFNHSCAPNCEAVLEDGRVFVEALRTIRPGEELTYDYRLEYPGPYDAESIQRYACHCRTLNCRGTLLAPRARSRRKSPRR